MATAMGVLEDVHHGPHLSRLCYPQSRRLKGPLANCRPCLVPPTLSIDEVSWQMMRESGTMKGLMDGLQIYPACEMTGG